MLTKEAILTALKAVKGPDGTLSLPESGALSDIVIVKDKVYFSILIDPARSMQLEPMRQAAQSVVAALPGVAGAAVTLTSQPGTVTSERKPGPKAQAATAREAVAGIKHIIAVASGKGGVGKSTTACNLALALARLGLRVGVLDADIYGPSMPKLFAIQGKPRIVSGRTLAPMEGYGLKVMSIGFLVEEETPMIWRGPMVMGAIQQMLREVDWGELDILVVDMPPGTGDAQLTLAQAVPLAGAVIVSTPQDLALIDARRGVAMFRRVDVPILGIIENMSYFLCPSCGTRSDIFGHGGARHEAERIGIPFLGEVPLHIDIRERADSGLPIVATKPDGEHARTYLAIASQVKERLEGGPQRTAPRIVIA